MSALDEYRAAYREFFENVHFGRPYSEELAYKVLGLRGRLVDAVMVDNDIDKINHEVQQEVFADPRFKL